MRKIQEAQKGGHLHPPSSQIGAEKWKKNKDAFEVGKSKKEKKR